MGSPKRKSSPEISPTSVLAPKAHDDPGLRRLENWLAFIVVVLAVANAGLWLGCERVLSQDAALGESDEQRLSLAIADIEADITRSFSARQIDDSADGADDSSAPGTSNQADPTTPNADGEFEVPSPEALKGHEVLLASKLLVPVADDSWCEVSTRAQIA